LIITDQTGYIFPCGQTDKLTSIMIELTNNPNLVSVLSSGAAEHIQNYSIKTATSGTLDAIEFISKSKKQAH
jgi:hypothetical protein